MTDFDDREYLRKLARYKKAREIGAKTGLVVGWLLSYALLGLLAFGVAASGWWLLTGQAPDSWPKAIGLMLLVFVGFGLEELLRGRETAEGEVKRRVARKHEKRGEKRGENGK